MKRSSFADPVKNNPIFRTALWAAYKFKYRNLIRKTKLDPQSTTYEILSTIQERGFYTIPNYFDLDFCERCIREFDEFVTAVPEATHQAVGGEKPDNRIFGINQLPGCGSVFGNDAFLLRLANEYTARNIDLQFTMANAVIIPNEYGSGGMWHRDGFFPELKCILYLKSVAEENGPFSVIEGSHLWGRYFKMDQHRYGMRFRQNRLGAIGDIIVQQEPIRLHKFVAKAGTLIIFDTSTIHRGTPMREGCRYAMTNYYADKDLIQPSLLRHYAPILTSDRTFMTKQGETAYFSMATA